MADRPHASLVTKIARTNRRKREEAGDGPWGSAATPCSQYSLVSPRRGWDQRGQQARPPRGRSGFGSIGHGLVTTEPILEIFTNPSCPACSALRLWLKQEGIAFVERDLTDAPAVGKAKLGSNLRGAPLAMNGDRRFHCSLEDRDP